MSQPFVGEIRMFGGTFAPAGWAMCQGQLMPISENETLFNLIGTTYGGDGQETFALPDLQGRVPIHAGQGPGLPSNRQLGELAGTESVTLNTNQMPVHTHAFLASTDVAAGVNPTGNVLGATGAMQLYHGPAGSPTMSTNVLLSIGGSQPHENMQPYLVLTFIISLFGIFPSQN